MTTPLRAKMIQEMQLQRFAPATQEAYPYAITELAKYYDRSPDRLTAQELRDYVLYLTQTRKLAFNSCNVAVAAMKFLYAKVLGWPAVQLELGSCRRPRQLPRIYSQEQVQHLFESIRNPKHRAFLMTVSQRHLAAVKSPLDLLALSQVPQVG